MKPEHLRQALPTGSMSEEQVEHVEREVLALEPHQVEGAWEDVEGLLERHRKGPLQRHAWRALWDLQGHVRSMALEQKRLRENWQAATEDAARLADRARSAERVIEQAHALLEALEISDQVSARAEQQADKVQGLLSDHRELLDRLDAGIGDLE